MQPAPPPVTISDPGTGEVYGDVIGSGPDREPWRPTEGQRLLGLGFASLVLAVLGVLVAQDMVRTDRRLDRESLAAVRLATSLTTDSPGARGEGPLSIGLRNDGPTLRLVSVRLGGSGLPDIPLNARLVESELVTLNFPDRLPCGPELLSDPMRILYVTLRTERGVRTTQEVPLDISVLRVVNQVPRARCGYFRVEDSLNVLPAKFARQQDDSVVVEVELGNRSVLPLRLTQLLPAPGLELEVRPALPVSIAPQTNPQAFDVSGNVRLRLVLRVRDCATYLENEFQIRRGIRPLVRAWVTRGSTVAESELLLQRQLEGDDLNTVDPVAELPDLLLDPCAGFFDR